MKVRIILGLSLICNIVGLALAAWMVQRVGGIDFVRAKLRGGANSAHYQARSEHFRMLPDAAGEIVFLGDSITQRCEWAEMLRNPQVKNRGIDGDKTTGVLARLDEVTAAQPAKIYLMIGINDLLTRSPAATAENIGKMVDRIQQDSPQTELILQSVLPVNNTMRNTLVNPADIIQLNNMIREIADKRQVNYLNLYSHFANEEGNLKPEYTQDGIHLSAAGYELWEQILSGASGPGTPGDGGAIEAD